MDRRTGAGTYGCVPMLIAMLFGLDPSPGMLVVPLIAFVSGFGWACFGIMMAGILKSTNNFNYVTSTIITPMFLVAGTFFPLSQLPQWPQVLSNVTRCTTPSSWSAMRLSAGRGRRSRPPRRAGALRGGDVAPGDQGELIT